jgi:hypothetical protein
LNQYFWQKFEKWLISKNFKHRYIVDAANVAYSGQNFVKGKFSYYQVCDVRLISKAFICDVFIQINLVVKDLLKRGDGDVLVLIPAAYAQNIVPNRVRQVKGISHTTAEDRVSKN